MTFRTDFSSFSDYHYFSGFCLKDEEELFDEYLIKNDFTVSGFSLGAQRAFEYVYEKVISRKSRIDKLQLFSPAFFQDKDKKFKRMQLMYFKKDAVSYCNNFLKNIAYPADKELESCFELGTYEELDFLLSYEWNSEKLQNLLDNGVEIEVYLGEKDKIIDSANAKDFFIPYSTVFYIKNAGHILRVKN